MWMNSYEIDDAVERAARGSHMPQLKGALYLQDFRDLIDSISDGWAYWSTGTKCSSDLQELVSRRCSPPTVKEIEAAKRKIRTFLKRNKQTRELTAVLEFLAKGND